MSGKRIVTRSILPVSALLALILAVSVVSSAVAQERPARRDRPRMGPDDLHEILDGLERGIESLKHLGRMDQVESLQKVANGLRRELRQANAAKGRGGDRERKVAEQQIKALKMARAAYREAGKEDGADILHYAIRAREVMLEGRRDEEAHGIRKRAPNRENTIELLVHAEGLYREWGNKERAAALSRMTEELWSRRDRPRRERDRPRTERGAARHQLEVMRSAMPALLEAERKDTAELLEHAIHSRELALEGRNDPKAREIRHSAPNLGQQVEILQYASQLWRKFGHPDKAEPIAALAKRMWANREGPRGDRREGKRDRANREERQAVEHQIEIMKLAMPALQEAGKKDSAEVLKSAIQVRQVNLQGRRGEEAEMVRKRAPSLGQQAEVLGLASRLWQEFGNEKKAHLVGGLAEKLGAHARERGRREGRERERHEKERRIGSGGERIQRLERNLRELQQAIERMREELEEMKHSIH